MKVCTYICASFLDVRSIEIGVFILIFIFNSESALMSHKFDVRYTLVRHFLYQDIFVIGMNIVIKWHLPSIDILASMIRWKYQLV